MMSFCVDKVVTFEAFGTKKVIFAFLASIALLLAVFFFTKTAGHSISVDLERTFLLLFDKLRNFLS